MADSSSSIYKTIVWILAILLVATLGLLIWYKDNRHQLMAQKDAEIQEARQLAADAARRLGETKEASEDCDAKINRLTGDWNAEKRQLTDELEAAKQENADAQSDLKILQAERDAANKRNASLQAELAKLGRQLADAANAQASRLTELEAEHETLLRQREGELKEETNRLRAALANSEPERASQLADLEQQIEEYRKTEKKSQLLEEKLATAEKAAAERDRALIETKKELDKTQAMLEDEKSAHAALKRKHELAVGEATDSIAKLQQELRATEEALETTKIEAANALKAAEKARLAEIAHADDKIADLAAKLQVESEALAALRREDESKVYALQGILDATAKELADVRADLAITKEAPLTDRTSMEGQVTAAEKQITDLEEALQKAQNEAARKLQESRREGQATSAHVRDLLVHIAALGGLETDRGILLTLAEADLRFPANTADLPEGELATLDAVAELLIKHKELSARIEGHTDSAGADQANLALSQKRADAAKQALVDRGVESRRLSAEGRGESHPIADNSTAEGRRMNRRVEIYVVEN